MQDAFTYIDLATVLPFYLFLLFGWHFDFRWLRVLRLSKVRNLLAMFCIPLSLAERMPADFNSVIAHGYEGPQNLAE